MNLKKVMSFVVVLIMLFGMTINTRIVTATENEYTYNDYKYIVNSGNTTITITKYLGSGGDIEIPSLIDGKKVVEIGNNAFYGCDAVSSIIIPDGVQGIGYGAFERCGKLKKLVIPSSVKRIDDYNPFKDCGILEEICVAEKNSDYKSVNGILFSKSGVTIIEYPPAKIETEYQIPNGVTSIGVSAFGRCARLKSITIPNSVTTIEGGAFEYCGFKSITIPDSVTTIEDGAFCVCKELTHIVIPNSVTKIEACTFEESGLTSITIPKNVTTIDPYAFENCSGLTEIYVDESNQNFKSLDGVLFNKNGTKLLKYPIAKTGETYKIPNGVTEIGYMAFKLCRGLKDITIPNSTTIIGVDAFSWSGLKTIKISNSVTKIEPCAFKCCNRLENVTIPNNVKTIEDSTFSGCSGLTSITIPNSMTTIEGSAFAYCNSLKSAYFSGNAPSVFGEDVFGNCSQDFKIHYKAKSTGFTSPTWHGYNTIKDEDDPNKPNNPDDPQNPDKPKEPENPKSRFVVNVLDSNTWEPIAGATVNIGDVSVVTNDKGIAEFKDIKLGVNDIHITKEGYIDDDYKGCDIKGKGCYFSFLDEKDDTDNQ